MTAYIKILVCGALVPFALHPAVLTIAECLASVWSWGYSCVWAGLGFKGIWCCGIMGYLVLGWNRTGE